MLKKEKSAIEYMSDDIRCETVHPKVNFTEVDEESTVVEESQNNLIINLLERHMDSQKQMIEMIAKTFTKCGGNFCRTASCSLLGHITQQIENMGLPIQFSLNK